MKKYFYHIFVLIALVALTSCSNTNRYFKVEGSIAGMPVQNVVLEEWGGDVDEIKLVDSVRSDKNGNFSLKGIYGDPALYRIRIGNKGMLIVVDGELIKLKSTWGDDLNNYTAAGSPGSASLTGFLSNYRRLNEDMLALQMAADSLNTNAAPDSVLMLVQGESDQKYKELIGYVKQFSDSTKSVPVALFAARMLLNSDVEMAYLETFSSKMSKRYPDNPFITEFRQKVKEKTAIVRNNGNSPAVGTTAPEFTLNTAEGKAVTLNSFKGKYVLIDFWASWCPPCRAENPNVVAAYKKYKDKNFTVLGVSLDNDKEKWKQAIAKDGLAWTQVSDLKGWDSETAAMYGVQSIPANFLLDPSGKIIAINLRGDDLDRVLSSKLITVAVEKTTAKK